MRASGWCLAYTQALTNSPLLWSRWCVDTCYNLIIDKKIKITIYRVFYIFTVSLWLWLVPGLVRSGVLRYFEEKYTCKNYNYSDLLYLDCSDRGLNELPEDLNYKAQVLLLANNNFILFSAELRNFTQTEVLDMSGNHLTESLPDYIQSWKNLDTLNLSNNNYDSWSATKFEVTAKKLDLSKNKINRVDEDAFTNMKNLIYLDLSENRLYDLSVTLFSQSSNLEILFLSRNYFNNVPRFMTSSLKYIYLSNCQIINFDVECLTNMQSLIEIDLSMNQIEYIPDNFGSYTVQKLDLSYNEINAIGDRTFSSLPHLAVLDLRGNEFKEVWSSSYFASNPFLREVLLKGNRWSCEGFSVNLLLTYEFLTKHPSKSPEGSLICYSPSNVTQLSWQQAYIRTWHAKETSDENYVFFAAMVGIIIGIVLTSLFCRGLMYVNHSEPAQRSSETTNLNEVTQPRTETVIMRMPVLEDLPPTYDEALLMPRLHGSFHSLPDFIDEVERTGNSRRSRSIGDLTEMRPRIPERRSVRRTVQIHIN